MGPKMLIEVDGNVLLIVRMSRLHSVVCWIENDKETNQKKGPQRAVQSCESYINIHR